MGHKFKIEATMQGAGTQLYLDGVPIKGVISYSLTGSAEEPTRLTLVMVTDGVEVEGEVLRVEQVKEGLEEARRALLKVADALESIS